MQENYKITPTSADKKNYFCKVAYYFYSQNILYEKREISIGSWCVVVQLKQCRGSSARDGYKWICVESSIVFLVVNEY